CESPWLVSDVEPGARHGLGSTHRLPVRQAPRPAARGSPRTLMGESFFWGLLAGSSLVLGGLLAYWLPIGRRALGLIMAFGAGVLISAVAFELVHEAFETTAGEGGVGRGLFLGSGVFLVGGSLDAHPGGGERRDFGGS